MENRSVKLVLNTLGKMHKTEFCLNIYTDGRNTNLADAIIKSTYKTALRSPDKTHTLGIHDNGTAYMDDTKVITNSDLANRLVMNTGSTGIQSPFSGSTSHRLQIGMDGGVTVWKTTDGGTTWNIVKNL